MSLSLIRKKIEEIDENIITLIAQRFRFLPEIIEEKKKHGLRAFQPEREQQLQMMYQFYRRGLCCSILGIGPKRDAGVCSECRRNSDRDYNNRSR